jgi:putative transposase
VWTADMTDIWTHEGWLHLAVVRDLFHREVVGGSIHPRMTADMVMNALTMAWFRKKPEPGLIHHSDRGSPYAGHTLQARLEAYGMVCSMSRKGTRYSTRATAEADLFDDIESFYNRRRQHSTLGYASPMTFLEACINTQQAQQLAASCQ